MTAAATREVVEGSRAAMGLEVMGSEAEGNWEAVDWEAAAGLAAAAADESDRWGATRLGRAFA